MTSPAGKVVLHIGLHRCASTSIQQALGTASPYLEALGWRVLLPKVVGRHIDWAPFRRVHSMGWLEFQRKSSAIVDLLQGHAGPQIISSENLPGLMPGVRSGAFYPDFDRFLQRLKYLEERSERPFGIRLVTRPREEWWQSVYAFRAIKGFAGDLEAFKAHCGGGQGDPVALGARLLDAGFDDVRIADMKTLLGEGGAGLAAFLDLPQEADLLTALSPPHKNATGEAKARIKSCRAQARIAARRAARKRRKDESRNPPGSKSQQE